MRSKRNHEPSGKRNGSSTVRRFRPALEQLEDRVAPTVDFTPQFGPETPIPGFPTGPVLQNTPVVLIFEGDYWLNPTGITEQDCLNAANNIVHSSYTDPLAQYGSTGRGTITVFHTDNSLPFSTQGGVQGFSDRDLAKVADSWMTLADVQAPLSDRSLYFVVTPPNVQDFDNNFGGFHDSRYHTEVDVTGQDVTGRVPYGWLGIFDQVSAPIDSFSRHFAHEYAEARTDPYFNDGNRFYPGTNWPLQDRGREGEIADYEPEFYQIRLPSGTAVQPFWSENTQNFVVADGNSQVFTLNALWQPDQIQSGKLVKQFDLVVNGDQLANHDDTTSIDTTRDGGVSVTLNGETVSFDAGQIRHLDVNSGNGKDTINVEGLPADVELTIYNGGQNGDSVNITPLSGNAARVEGSVYIDGGYGHNTLLAINDSNAPLYRLQSTFEVNATTIVRHDQYTLGATDSTLNFDGVGRLNIYAGSQTKDVTVQAGQIAGTFSIGVFGTGQTSVTMNDSSTRADSVVYSVTQSQIARTSSFFGSTITVEYSNVSMASINAALGAVYNISGTGTNPMNINAGAGGNTFNVGDGTTPLDAIFGTLNIVASGSNNHMVVDDRGAVNPGGSYQEYVSFDLAATPMGGSVVRTDTTTFTEPLGSQTSVTQQQINYSGIQDVVLYGGAVGSTIDLHGPNPGILLAKLAIHGNTGYDALILDDTTLAQPASYIIDHTKLRRTTPISDESLNFTDIDRLQIKGGGQGNVFKVNDSPGPIAAINSMGVELDTGAGAGTATIAATTGPVTINGQNANDAVTIGVPARGINDIRSDVTVLGAAQTLTVNDAATATPMTYAMDATHFSRTSPAKITNIFYSGLTASIDNFILGNGGNKLTVDGTPTVAAGFGAGINIYTGNGNDAVNVHATSAPLNLDLGGGNSQRVAVGDSAASLDNIHGSIDATGAGFIVASVSNAASTTPQVATIDTVSGNTQQITRYKADQITILNTFSFRFKNQGRLSYDAGQGGDTIFLHGTPVNSTTVRNGGAGQDVFWVEGDQTPLLGPVFVNGTVSDGDIAYYYDYFSTTPQTYTFQASSSNPRTPNRLDEQIVTRGSAAPITYLGIRELVTYQANVGGNQTFIQGVPTGEFLNMVTPDKAMVKVGSPSTGMTQILGDMDLGYGKQVAVTLDDTNDQTGRNIVLHPKVDAYGDWISGMSPGAIYLRLGDNSSVKLLGGAGNDTFSMGGIDFVSSMSIDGGKGVNTLDYSGVTGLTDPTGIYVNLLTGEASGLAGGIKRIQNVIGSPFNDILVGNGGNVLNGGAGRDVLIAGATPSILYGGDGEDILIGGTTAYDTNRAALEQVLAQWGSSLGYSLLIGKVTSNGGGNTLFGQAGSDLFFMGNGDNNMIDIEENEMIVYV